MCVHNICIHKYICLIWNRRVIGIDKKMYFKLHRYTAPIDARDDDGRVSYLRDWLNNYYYNYCFRAQLFFRLSVFLKLKNILERVKPGL